MKFSAAISKRKGEIKVRYVTRQDDISLLPLSVRSQNCLRNANIRTIGAMIDYPEDQFINIRNMGVRSVNEITCFVQTLLNGTGEYVLVDSCDLMASEMRLVVN